MRSQKRVELNVGPTLARQTASLRLTDTLLLFVPPAWSALGVVAANPVGIPHAERLVGLALTIWLAACVVALIAVRAGAPNRPTTVALFFGLVLLVSGRGLVDRLGPIITSLAIFAVVAALFRLTQRLHESSWPDVLLIGTAVALLSGMAIDAFESHFDQGESNVLQRQMPLIAMETRPDVLLLVLDGHPGLQALELDFGEQIATSVGSTLEGAGFELSDSAWSSYRSTAYSIPSLLNMGYPVDEVAASAASNRRLYEIISGDNATRAILAANEYETHMIESAWSGSACGERYDECVVSPLLDEAMFTAIERSIVGPTVLEQYGYAFTAGAQSTMKWLNENASTLDRDESPSFVFAHIMAPHPPFFLDEGCRRLVSQERSGVSFQRAGVDAAVRGRFLMGQIDCLGSFLGELSALLSEDTVVVVVSDHGTDRRNQLAKDPAMWTEPDIVERMNALVAVRGLDGCRMPEVVLIPNVMRHVFSCLSGKVLSPVPPRMFLGTGVELGRDDLDSLIQSGLD